MLLSVDVEVSASDFDVILRIGDEAELRKVRAWHQEALSKAQSDRRRGAIMSRIDRLNRAIKLAVGQRKYDERLARRAAATDVKPDKDE